VNRRTDAADVRPDNLKT